MEGWKPYVGTSAQHYLELAPIREQLDILVRSGYETVDYLTRTGQSGDAVLAEFVRQLEALVGAVGEQK
jgi:hypothetical protein